MDNRIHIKKYDDSNHGALIEFLQNCLPESGRGFDLQGRHNFYCDIDKNFKSFWVMFDRDEVIGTVAVKELDAEKCELKSLYLYERYHGNGLGRRLITKAIEFAAAFGYKYMYLDSLSVHQFLAAQDPVSSFLEASALPHPVNPPLFQNGNL